METKSRYFSPEVLQKIAHMELRARMVAEGFYAGMHKSNARGFDVEFLEHREYSPGDDLRHVDWKLFGKSDKYFVKQYAAESSLRSHIIIDSSASMRFGKNQNGETKLDYASLLSVALAYLLLKQGDAVGMIAFDLGTLEMIEPRAAREHLYRILTALETCPAGTETAIAPILAAFSANLKRRSLIILISDLLDDQEKVIQTLKVMKGAGHELAVFHILDEEEVEFPFSRATRFVDMETGQTLTADAIAVRTEYKRNLAEFLNRYRRFCRDSGMEFVSTTTSMPVEKLLLEFLTKREMRKRA